MRVERKFKGGMRDCKGSAGSGKLVIFMARRGKSCLFGAGNGLVDHRLLKWWRLERKLQVFAGDGMSGNCDGIASKLVYAQNSTTMSMSMSVVYVCDAQTSYIKILNA